MVTFSDTKSYLGKNVRLSSQFDLLIRNKRFRYLSKLVSKVTDFSSCCSLPEAQCKRRRIWFKTLAANSSAYVNTVSGEYKLWSKLKPERRPGQRVRALNYLRALPFQPDLTQSLHLHSCFPLLTCRHHFRNIWTVQASGCSHTPPIIQQSKSMHVCIAAYIQKIWSNFTEYKTRQNP